jgi:hypothetical protein
MEDVLEAIKLFLFVKNSAFIIGADSRLVEAAVRRRFPQLPGDNAEVGRDYLEKIIQYPVRVPPLNACELETYINFLFASKAKLAEGLFETTRKTVLECNAESLMAVRFNHGVALEHFKELPPDLVKDLALAERLAPILALGLNGNPRQCKRFLNTLMMRMDMAESRKLPLQKRILAKLMLLEYLNPEWFKRLATVQAAEDGRPDILRQLEHKVSAKDSTTETPTQDSPSTDGTTLKTTRKKHSDASDIADSSSTRTPAADFGDFATWLTDPWMRDWLASEPAIAGEDLRPYFYFSRDSLGQLGAAVRRMTPRAQETLEKLLQESEGVRVVALKQAPSLSPADAAAVFEALVVRVGQDEDLNANTSAFPRLFEWVKARPELCGQLLSFLARLPVTDIPLQTTAKIMSLTKGTETEPAARQLLETWRKSSANKQLATLAAKQLERPER